MEPMQTISEKILSKHAGYNVRAGEYVISDIDVVMAHDTTCAWAIQPFQHIANNVIDKDKIFIAFDHAYPPPNVNAASLQAQVRKFASKHQIPINTAGISHQILAESRVLPGQIILGADSHTPTSGAIGALAIGVGSTDAAVAMASGKAWLKVPGTLRANVEGKLPDNVHAKDLILSIAGIIGPEGAAYKTLEFGGSCIRQLSMSERLTLTNMAAEFGAKAAIIEPDEVTFSYLAQQGRAVDAESFCDLRSDTGCHYDEVLELDASNLTAQVALPHEIDNVIGAAKLATKRVSVDQVFIGSCTNGRIEDLQIVYDILSQQQIHPDVRVIITPASMEVYREALRRDIIDGLLQLGATVTSPGCGVCLGRHGGVLADGEVCLATSNRNFCGRMGSPDASIYLCSPATAAYSAVKGYITHD